MNEILLRDFGYSNITGLHKLCHLQPPLVQYNLGDHWLYIKVYKIGTEIIY